MPKRFFAPISIQVIKLWRIPCSFDRQPSGVCLGVDLEILHDHEEGRRLDLETYPVDQHVLNDLVRDFGPYASTILRRISLFLQRASLDEEQWPSMSRIEEERFIHYRVLSHVLLPLDVERYISELATEYHLRSGKTLVITSGTRTPESQAAAMFLMLNQGVNLRRLYRKTGPALEIKRAYLRARSARKRRAQIVKVMATTIRQQIARSIYISPHLKAGAVDIRSRNMTRATKKIFRQSVALFNNLKLNREEKKPPHFHLEVHTARWSED